LIRADIDNQERAIGVCAAALGQPGGHDAASDHRPTSRGGRSTYRFLRHYAETVAVMFAGMFVLYAPTGVLLGALGTSWTRLSPAMNVFTMALTMTVPMVAWMCYRGHAWRPNIEMAASMLLPTVVVMGMPAAGVGTSASLMVPEHAGMLACMLVAMLLRRDEYSCAAHHAGHPHAAIAA
jgi:hypothetical protein